MLLYNLIRLTLATGLITFLISKDVDKRKLFTVVYTGIFLFVKRKNLRFYDYKVCCQKQNTKVRLHNMNHSNYSPNYRAQNYADCGCQD